MKEKKTKDWCILIIDRVDKFYSGLFDDAINGYTQEILREGWQMNATLEAVKPMFSTIHWPKAGKIRARAKLVGGLLGHSVAHYQTLCDPRFWDKVCGLSDTIFGSGDSPISRSENIFLLAKPDFDKAVSCAMQHACRQSVGEQVSFYDGYSKALRRGSVTPDFKGVAATTRTDAYQIIAALGPLMQNRWKSVADVHALLTRLLGPQRAGGLKRTEGICSALGLRLANPGRPRRREPGA